MSIYRGVINFKAGKAAALPKFSDKLTLSHSGWVGRLYPTISFASPKFFGDYSLDLVTHS